MSRVPMQPTPVAAPKKRKNLTDSNTNPKRKKVNKEKRLSKKEMAALNLPVEVLPPPFPSENQEDDTVAITVPQSKELESAMEAIFGIQPTNGDTSTGEMVLKSMAKIKALEDRLNGGPEKQPLQVPPVSDSPPLLTEEEENEADAFLASLCKDPVLSTLVDAPTQTDPPPQSPVVVTDLSCPIHEWEPLCPGSCGEFSYERCGHEGCLVFIPTRHLDTMLKELKDHLHPALKAQWSSLRCDCGLRPRMKLILSPSNYQKVFLTCGVNQKGVEQFGKERCGYFQWIHWKPRVRKEEYHPVPWTSWEPPLVDKESKPEREPEREPEIPRWNKFWRGGFVVAGTKNTIAYPEEFRNLSSRPYLKEAYEMMKQFPPKMKKIIYVQALWRYLKEEDPSWEMLKDVQWLKDKYVPDEPTPTFDYWMRRAAENLARASEEPPRDKHKCVSVLF